MFNTGIGQHILKNPLVVNGIIEKVGSVDFDFFCQNFHFIFLPSHFSSKESDSFLYVSLHWNIIIISELI